MKSGTGFFLAVGTGLGLGLFSNNNWWWQGLISILIITLLHIITKSDYLKDSINKCNEKNQNFNMTIFFIISFSINTLIVGLVFGLVSFIKSII